MAESGWTSSFVGIALSNVVPFREIVNRTLVIERLVAKVSTGFAVLALLIAGVGLPRVGGSGALFQPSLRSVQNSQDDYLSSRHFMDGEKGRCS